MSNSEWLSKPSAGYKSIESEFEASLRRAFVDKHADAIILCDRRQMFLFESVIYGAEKGWLIGKFIEPDEQSGYYEYRLTEKGKSFFKLSRAK